VDGFAEVTLLLRIPPATVGISELTLHAGRVGVVVVLGGSVRMWIWIWTGHGEHGGADWRQFGVRTW
jgi:hypothetical protein